MGEVIELFYNECKSQLTLRCRRFGRNFPGKLDENQRSFASIKFDATLRYSMDGCRSKNDMAFAGSTSVNDASDKDRKQGMSSSKMREVEEDSTEFGIKSRVCSDGESDEICWRSLSQADCCIVNPWK
jgi:hypothetical protein